MYHTQKPWVARVQRNGVWEIDAGGTFPVATTAGCIGGVEGEANALRIAACVNACAGIESPKRAIADLLDALQRVMRHIPETAGGCSLGDDMYRARKAIAQAGGES